MKVATEKLVCDQVSAKEGGNRNEDGQKGRKKRDLLRKKRHTASQKENQYQSEQIEADSAERFFLLEEKHAHRDRRIDQDGLRKEKDQKVESGKDGKRIGNRAPKARKKGGVFRTHQKLKGKKETDRKHEKRGEENDETKHASRKKL